MAATMPIYAGITHARIGLTGLQWPRQRGGPGTESLYADETKLTVAPLSQTAPSGRAAR
jgi:predicted molibdopterin-dependent oxidoreductase YjgC